MPGLRNGVPVIAKIPIRPETAQSVDAGTIEYLDAPWLDEAAGIVEKM